MVWILLTVIALVGCHKHPSATSTSSASQQAQSEVPPTAAQQIQPGVESRTAKPLDGYAHPFMTAQLHTFVAQTGRFPTNFAELARARLDVVPRTPPGMTWAIDRVTQEVKLVKK